MSDAPTPIPPVTAPAALPAGPSPRARSMPAPESSHWQAGVGGVAGGFLDPHRQRESAMLAGGDAELDMVREELVAVSRRHAGTKGDLYAIGIARILEYAIPERGVRPIGRNPDAKAAAAWFCGVADAGGLDETGVLDLYEYEWILLRHLLVDGDVLLHRVEDGAVQIIPCERIGSLLRQRPSGAIADWLAARGHDPSSCRIRDGVVLSGRRRPLAYLAWSYDEFDQVNRTAAPLILDAAHCWHLSFRHHVSQTRGLPPYLQAVRRSANTGDFDDSTAKSAAAQASLPTAIRSQSPAELARTLPGAADPSLAAGLAHDLGPLSHYGAASIQSQLSAIRSGGANVLMLYPGDDLQMPPASQPGAHYDTYMGRAARTTAAVFGMAVELMMLDFEKANFASGRLAIRESWPTIMRAWEQVQASMRWIYAWRVRRAVRSGVLRVDPVAALDVHWTKRAMPSADPRSEIAGVISGMDRGLASPQRYLADQGTSMDEVLDDVQAFNAAAAARGIQLFTTPGATQAGGGEEQQINRTADGG